MNVFDSYAEPPVVEAVMALEYLPPDGLGVRELVHVQDRLPGMFCRYDEHPAFPPSVSEEASEPLRHMTARLWAMNESDTLLVQLQADRVVLNWRKREGSPNYPGYSDLASIFTEVWSVVCEGHDEVGLTIPAPRVAEFTYLNEVWDQDGLTWTQALSPVDNLDDLPGSTGLIHFHMERPLMSPSHEDEVIEGEVLVDARKASPGEPSVLVISTRMNVFDGQLPLDRIDVAHLTSRVTFEALTTAEAHTRWGKNL